MIKKAVYSYKLIDDYWKGQSETFYKLARLSLKLAKRHYTTVLYCDRRTDRNFKENDLYFDEVVILNSLRDVNEHTYGLAKIYAMMEQNEPYIMLDLDTLIFEPIITPHTITYGYKEGEPENIAGTHYINNYYLNSYEEFKDRIDIQLNWLTFPNNSLVAVNNPFIVKKMYEKILRIMNGDWTKSSVQFYEQFLLYNYLAYYKTDIGFLYEYSPFSEQLESYDINNALAKKFVHLDFYFRQPKSHILIDEIEEHTKIIV